MLCGWVLQDLAMRGDREASQVHRLFSHMIFTALSCYTTPGGLLHRKPYFAFDLATHASRTLFDQFLECPCTIAAGQKDLGTIRMAISSAQGTLRATAQLDLYLYLGRQ